MSNGSDKDFVFASFLGFERTFNSWVNFILSKDFPDLIRRNAISLWISSLQEFIEKSEKRSSSISNIIIENSSFQSLSDELIFLEKVAHDVLSKFNENEQIIIWLIRNQAVHGHLSLYFHDDLGIPIYDSESKKVNKIKRTRQDLYDAGKSSLAMSPSPTNRILETESLKELLDKYNDIFGEEALVRKRELLFE